MSPKAVMFFSGAGILALCLATSPPLRAQATGATVTGTVTGPSGAAVPNAKVSVKNIATSQSVEAQANSAGIYSVPNLMPGDYEVSISAEGFATTVSKLTLAAGARQTLDSALVAASRSEEHTS